MPCTARLCLIPFFFLMASCAELLDEPAEPKLTPLQIQSLQQRELETDKATAFASVISVFQDLGYMISSADKETGFISAAGLARSKDEETFTDLVFDALLDIDDEYGVVTVQTKATAFVEAFADQRTSVRLSFVKSQSRSGQTGQISAEDEQLLDAEIYRNAFDKIDNSIFVREAARS